MKCCKRLRTLRKNNKMAQKTLAGEAGISQRTYSHYESGSRRIPMDHLIVLAKYYDCSLDYLSGASGVHSTFPSV